jgi:hypothetical protein
MDCLRSTMHLQPFKYWETMTSMHIMCFGCLFFSHWKYLRFVEFRGVEPAAWRSGDTWSHSFGKVEKTLTFILIKLSDWLWQCLILVPLSYWRFCSLEVWFSLTATGYTGGSDDRFIATQVLANDYNHVYHVLWLVFLLTLEVCGGSLDSEGWIRCLRIRGHLIGHNFKFDWIMRLLMDNFKNTYCP